MAADDGHFRPELCAPGELCNQADVGSQSAETPCPTGYFCVGGQKYQCYAGYICIEGATTPTPIDGTLGKYCPAGSYCDAGATQTTNADGSITYTGVTGCPAGYYMPYQGAEQLSDCIECIGDQYCPTVGLTAYGT